MIFYPHPEIKVTSEPVVPINVPANVPVNERQQWFLNQLGAGNKVKATGVAVRWNVTEKTAKRDIAALKKHGIIEFAGPLKTGFYRIRETQG